MAAANDEILNERIQTFDFTKLIFRVEKLYSD